MSLAMEKELTCSICTDLLYDPVIFLDCLHTNCGACAKSWFASLNNNAINASSSSAATPAKYTCPVCRSEVRATRHNSAFQSLLEDFIAQNPDKDRTPEEKTALQKLYTPGSGVLPGEVRVPPITPPLANPSSNSSSSSPSNARSPPPPTLPVRRGRPAPSSSRSAPPASPARNNPTSSDELSRRFLDALNLDSGVSCFHCQRRVDYAMFCRCLQCDIVTCNQCFRSDKGCRRPSVNHVRVMQKLQLRPTRHIQTGVFCDICETWCDKSWVDGGMNCYFWACTECNDAGWEVCMACVSKGNCCSHELQLYTNSRPSNNGSVRGYTVDMGSRLEEVDLDDRGALLSSLGYVRWTNFNVTCDSCQLQIPPDHSYLHCLACNDGQWDICMECWTRNAEASDLFDGEDTAGFPCQAGHKMLLLSQNGKEGTHKLILDVPHDPPDYVAKTPAVEGGGLEATARCAVALKSHWPDPQNVEDGAEYIGDTPGVRPWDFGGLLAFPKKAAISDIWVAFTEGDGDELVEYLWGWYGGVGGIFPRDCVQFTD